jgi:hypothetical protein
MRCFGTKHEIWNEIEEEREIVVDIEMRKKNWVASNKNEEKMNSVARNDGMEHSILLLFWSFVYCVIILCVSLLSHVYCFTVCVLLSCILLLPDYWLEVSIRKVLRPTTSAQVFFGFPVSKSEC